MSYQSTKIDSCSNSEVGDMMSPLIICTLWYKTSIRKNFIWITTELDFLLLYNLEVQLLKIGGTRGTNRGWQKELSAIRIVTMVLTVKSGVRRLF